MLIDTRHMVSATEANQNFSNVSRVVDEHGMAVIMKNNAPKYKVLPFYSEEQVGERRSKEEIRENMTKIANENSEALHALAK